MKVITAPEEYTKQPGDHPTLFLAGGIRNCQDWQSLVIERLNNVPLILFNPRRIGEIDLADHVVSREQIAWEYRHLEMADAVLFWFPKETVCPITLFELGDYWRKPIVIGTDPEYARRFDIIEQLSLRRPLNVGEVVDSLDQIISGATRLPRNIGWPIVPNPEERLKAMNLPEMPFRFDK